MRKLHVFNHISLDGFICDPEGDMAWVHETPPDKKWEAFVTKNAQSGGTLLFGRVTYDMMVAYWPTDAAKKAMPEVAAVMNESEKIVFSRKLAKSPWENTRIVKGDIVEEVQRMKAEEGPPMVLMGSASIVSQLTAAGLIDSYQMVAIPILIGRGKTMFAGVEEQVHLKLVGKQSFDNGNVVLDYERVTTD